MALLLDYLRYTQKKRLTTIAKIGYHSSEGLVLMDDVTIKNLEIFASSYELNTKYSLF
jgi:DNA mismatch repair ATPase MutS